MRRYMVAAMLLAAGTVSGNGGRGLIDRRVANGVLIAVTVIWAVTFLVDVFLPDYDPPPGIQAAFLAIAGLGFGSGVLRGGSNGS